MRAKTDNGRFLANGMIIYVMDNYSYLVRRDCDGKMVKRAL